MRESQRAGDAPRSAPAGGYFHGRNDADNSRKPRSGQRRPLSTATLNAALVGALRDADPADRGRLLAWVTERGLIGLVHERGPLAAAGHAYRLADVLAGGVQ